MPTVVDPQMLLPHPKQLFWKGEYLTPAHCSIEIRSCPDATWIPAWWEEEIHSDQRETSGGLALYLSTPDLPEAVRALLESWGWLNQVEMLENEEAYLLAIGPHQENVAAVIVARTPRGAAWGLRRIVQLAGWRPSTSSVLSQPVRLPKLCLRDAPDFPLRGMIEGFYGTPWTHEKRLAMIRFLGETMMNSYAYAPKDDPYHRQRWRDAYPESAWHDLGELAAACRRESVDFWFCISPGKDIILSKEDDVAALCDKCAAVEGLGVSHFALLMDDIDPRLSNASDQQRFTSPAAAQASLANRLYDFLSWKEPGVQLLFCPTEYWQPGDSPYRRTLRSTLRPEIGILWTGIGVVAPQVSGADAAQAQAWFDHPLVLWDNYPVTDFDRSLLLLGPLRNRDVHLPQQLHGILANPMELAEASQFALATYADYTWNAAAYEPYGAWQRFLACIAREGADVLAQVAVYFTQSALWQGEPQPLADHLAHLWEAEAQWEKVAPPRGQEPWAAALLDVETDFQRMATAPVRLQSMLSPALYEEIAPWLHKLESVGLAGLAALDALRAWRTQETVTLPKLRLQLEARWQAAEALPQKLLCQSPSRFIRYVMQQLADKG